MECLFKRKYGNPTWYADNFSGRNYPQVRQDEFYFILWVQGFIQATHYSET